MPSVGHSAAVRCSNLHLSIQGDMCRVPAACACPCYRRQPAQTHHSPQRQWKCTSCAGSSMILLCYCRASWLSEQAPQTWRCLSKAMQLASVSIVGLATSLPIGARQVTLPIAAAGCPKPAAWYLQVKAWHHAAEKPGVLHSEVTSPMTVHNCRCRPCQCDYCNIIAITTLSCLIMMSHCHQSRVHYMALNPPAIPRLLCMLLFRVCFAYLPVDTLVAGPYSLTCRQCYHDRRLYTGRPRVTGC